MRSWLSLSNSSQAFMFCWRLGTLSRSMRMPTPPLALVSAVEQMMPAAPMSYMPTSAPVGITSRQASSSFFSWKGSPT